MKRIRINFHQIFRICFALSNHINCKFFNRIKRISYESQFDSTSTRYKLSPPYWVRSCMFSYYYYFLSTICHEATTQQAFNYIPKDKYFGVQKVYFFLLQFFLRAEEKQGYSGKSIDFKLLLLSCFFHPFWLPIFFSKSFLNSCLKLEKTPVCHEKWLFRFLKNLMLTFLKRFHNFIK